MAVIGPCRPRAQRCVDERAALDQFCARVRDLDPDVLTGWNVIDFDLTVLQRIAVRVNHPFQLGRDPGAIRLRQARGLFRQRAGFHSRTSGARRHRSVARRLRAHG